MKEKIRIKAGFLVSALVVITLAMWMLSSSSVDYGMLIIFPILIVIVVMAVWVVNTKAKNVRKGLPSRDELSDKVMHRAGYYTYLATIWIALGTQWYNDFASDLGWFVLDASRTVEVIILLSAVLFFGLYFYFNRKGNIE